MSTFPAVLDFRCSHCKCGSLAFEEALQPTSELGRSDTLYRCTSANCGCRHLVVWHGNPHSDDPDVGIYPPVPGRLPADGMFAGTLFQRLHDEAWRCYSARRLRAAMLLALSALQCLVRLYVEPKDGNNFTPLSAEIKEVELKLGLDLSVARPLNEYVNRLKHPALCDLPPLSRETVRSGLGRLDQVAVILAPFKSRWAA
jgi:hypothetical protein